MLMSDKELALETIRRLPEESSLEDISSRLEYLSAIRKGLDEVERGEVIPHEEVKRQLGVLLVN